MPKRILIVEDHEDSRSILVTILRRFGYRTIEAESGIQGIEKALSEKPDLVIMDLDLPGASGLDSARAIKENPSSAHIPIIAYSAWPSQIWRKKALSVGMVDYLQKPVSWEVIKATLEKHLSRVVMSQL
jgi:two-component system, cell cycle response regulator DivK